MSKRSRKLLILAVASVLLGAGGGVAYHLSVRVPAGPAFGASLVPASPAASQPSTARTTLRIGTFNIHGGKMRDGQDDLAGVADALHGFDVVGLNEVRNESYSSDRSQAAQLASDLHIPHLFAPTERRWGREHFGNAILCDLPVRSWMRIPLAGTEKSGFRNALLVRADIEGQPLNILVTHISVAADRRAQLRQVAALFNSLAAPAVLMGDLNTRRDDAEALSLLGGSGNEVVRPEKLTGEVRKDVDWIVARGLTVQSSGAVESGLSDHPLVWAELSLPAKP